MKTHGFTVGPVVIGLVCLLSVNNTFAQWPQWRGPMRDGISKETNLLKVWPAEGPKLIWSVDTVGDGFSSTAIQDGMVYTTGKRDSVEILTALDLNGNVKWQKIIGRASQEKDWPQSRCTPTVYKNKVYAITVYGDVACFDSKSGNIDWQMPAFEKFEGKGYNLPQGGIAESPLVIDDKLIFTPCGNTTTMVALNRLTGETIWKSESIQDTTNYTSPVLISVNNKKTIFTSTKKYDLLVDCKTGQIIWKDRTISGMIPLVNKNEIYYTGAYKKGGTLCSWNDEWSKRSVLWEDTVSANSIGGAVLFKDKIVVSGNSKGLFCIDLKTGKALSQYEKINYCNLIVADNLLYCYEDKMGRVSLFKMNGNDLELVSSFKITLGTGPRVSHLAISDGILFVRRGKVLMAYNIKQQ
ncbi:MAG: PQQ-binding-like beta-propeller repeat protein [Bacteroidia bacterium]|nr:PQQ-binding-like beta-propeller repeat protein [Bacteroidia bacterium]